MNFIFQLGYVAAAAGIGWLAKKRLTEPSDEWEDRISFYDYIEFRCDSLDNVLTSDNGQIIDIKILWKPISGSLNMNVDFIKIDHVVVVLKTNKGEYWSIEKNNKAIYVQKSDQEKLINNHLEGVRRDIPIEYDEIKQGHCLQSWGINYSNSYDISQKSVNINAVLLYLEVKELPIKFSYLENCKIFLKRLLNFIFHGLKSSVTTYSYTSNLRLYWTELVRITNQCTFQDVKWLYKKSSFVGFLVKTNNGCYWSFEQHLDRVFIQQSRSEELLMRTLNGIKREESLKRGNAGFERLFDPTTIKTSLSIILPCFKETRIVTNDVFGIIEDGLMSVYNCNSLGLTLFDYRIGSSTNIVSASMHTSVTVMITSIKLMSKLVYDHRGDQMNLSINDCIVLLLGTSDGEYWSVERHNNVTHVQRSVTEKDLLDKFESVSRLKSLSQCQSCEGYLKRITIAGLLEFIIEFHRKYPGKQCDNILHRTLEYFRCF